MSLFSSISKAVSRAVSNARSSRSSGSSSSSSGSSSSSRNSSSSKRKVDTSGLSGYALAYAKALNSGANNSQAHSQATQINQGSGISVAEHQRISGGVPQSGVRYEDSSDRGSRFASSGQGGQVLNGYEKFTPQLPPPPPPPPQQQQQQLAQDYIDQLNEARRRQTIAQLDKSRSAALSNLGQERSGIQPRYYDARNQAAAQNQQGARNFAEFMAARGGSSSGSNAQAQLSQNMALQGSLGNLGRQENQAFDDIDRRTTGVQNAYQSDVASAEAGIQADRMQALLKDYYVSQERGDRQAQLDIQNELARAGLSGTFQGERTLQGQQLDYNMSPFNPSNQSQILSNEISKLKLQNLPREMELGLEQLEQQIKTGQINNQSAEYQLYELTNPNSVTNQAKSIELELSKINLQNAPREARLRIEKLQKQINQIGRAPYRSPQQQEMDKIKVEQAKIELDNLKNPSANAGSASDYISDINKRFLTEEVLTDSYENPVNTGKQVVSNPTGLEKYILSLGLPDSETDKLYRYYGLR